MLYCDGVFQTAPKFFPQLFKIRFLSNSHNVSLTFFLMANKHQMSYEDVFTHTASEAAKMIFQQLFCWLRNRHSQRSDKSVARLWSISMSFPLRIDLMAENTTCGSQHILWKGKSEINSVLEENVRTFAFTTGGSQRLLCVGLYIQSSEAQASGTVLRLPARKLYWCRLQFSSTCLVRMFFIISEDH